MANSPPSTPSTLSSQIPNGDDPTKPFIFVNIQNTIKLTPTNYISWKMQVEAILIGYDLYKFIDGTLPSPPPIITTNAVEKINPEYQFCTRQDKLLFGALIDTLSPSLVTLVSQAQTTKDIWDILAKTYAKPSRGHIKQLKDQFNRTSKGNRSITEYMQSIKACADQLAALGKPVDHEDLIDRVLLGLDTPYNSIIESVNSRDIPISFEELHEKLINRELTIQQNQNDSSLPVTAFAVSTRPPHRNYGRPNNPGILPTPGNNFNKEPRPFLGKCQWCRKPGHVVSQCPQFTQRFPNAKPPAQSYLNNRPYSFSQKSGFPQAHAASMSGSSPSTWLLDSGTSHHVTTDLQNLALHAPYDGTEELIIGDGTGSQNRGVSPSGSS